MAVRQYIGARYVPKFFDNPNGGSGWLPNVEYEALTIVTYLGNSYTSKKPVPTSVGNPLENADYWVASGNYSEQIEEYRREVAEVDRKLISNYTTGKHIAIIGDSNAVIFQNSSKIEELCPNATFDKLAVGGASFINNNGNNVYNQIDNITSTPDIIILWCGGNDIGRGTIAENVESVGTPDVKEFPESVDLTTSFNGAKSVIKRIRTLYPSTKIVSVIRDALKWETTDILYSFGKYFFHFLNEIYKYNRIPVINLDNYVNLTRTIPNSFNYGFTDGIHYSSSAMEYIATIVLTCIATGCMANTTYDFPAYFPPNYDETGFQAMCEKATWVGLHCYDFNTRQGGEWKLFYQQNGYGSMCILATDIASCRVELRTPWAGDFYVVNQSGKAITSFNNVALLPDVSTPFDLACGEYAVSMNDIDRFDWLPSDWGRTSGELVVHKFPTNDWKYFRLVKNFPPFTQYVKTPDHDWTVL